MSQVWRLLPVFRPMASVLELHRIGLDLSDGYPEEHSGRQALHKLCQIDAEYVIQLVKQFG